MRLRTLPYHVYSAILPAKGRHIVGQYDDTSVVVYQAFRAEIGQYAASNGHFGGDFSFARMSWIKPNFLWMMYRSGWGVKAQQETTLAIRLKRDAFDNILAHAVEPVYVPGVYGNQSVWKQALEQSSIRLQWDPDHDPYGGKLERRAVQIGLRGEVLAQYATEWIISIEDISEFVHEQSKAVQSGDLAKLLVPCETVYPIIDERVARRLQLSTV
jgi:Domain of unknown function (DUF4291)